MTDITTDASPPKPRTGIFIGSKGLRAGWGVLLFVLVFAVVGFAFAMTMHFVLHIHGPKPADVLDAKTTLIIEAVQAGLMFVATVITALIERRSLAKLGFGLKGSVMRFVTGTIVGLVAMSVLIGLLYLTHAITVGAPQLRGMAALSSGGIWLAAFLFVGFSEELAFRAYLQQTLTRSLNFRWALVILSVLFAAAHIGNGGENPIGLANVVLAGVILALSVWRTGTIWWAVGFHMAWDWAQSFLFGVADSGHPAVGSYLLSKPMGADWLSGGSVGPEGSLLASLVMIVVGLLIWFTMRTRDEAIDGRW